MRKYDDALINSFSRGIFALKPSLLRLFAFSVVNSVSGFAEANLDYAVLNYVLLGLMFISFGLLLFEGARFGLILFNKFGGWISFAVLIATFMVGRLTVVAAESLELYPVLRITFWPLIIVFGSTIGILLAAIQKYEADESDSGVQPGRKE